MLHLSFESLETDLGLIWNCCVLKKNCFWCGLIDMVLRMVAMRSGGEDSGGDSGGSGDASDKGSGMVFGPIVKSGG